MNWEQLNEVLKDLNALRWGSNKITQQVLKTIDPDGEQGESGLSYEVYKLTDDLYIKLTIGTDSYGDNEHVTGVEFVQPKQKVVTEFEPTTGKINKDGILTYEQIFQIIKSEEDSVSEFGYMGGSKDYLNKKANLVTIESVATERLNTSEIGFIKIPVDFQSLHDLKELVSNYDLVTRLTTALNGYNRSYIDSYLMTLDEVLKFIPEEQQKQYKISCRGNSYDFNTVYAYRSYVYEETKETVPASKYAYLIPKSYKGKNGVYVKLPLDVALNKLFDREEELGTKINKKTIANQIQKNERVFMVDVDNKIVELCPWAVNKNEFTQVIHTGKLLFDLDKNKNLTLKCEYTYTDSQHIGGVRISTYGGNGYLRGGHTEYYQRTGWDLYKFCTRTNKFLGYQGCKITKKDQREAWIKTSGF